MGVVQASKGVLKPVSKNLLSETIIVCRLAKATLGNRSKIDWDKYAQHYDHIRQDIEHTIAGFQNYNQRLAIPGGFYLPNANRDGAFNTTIYGLNDSYRGIYNERRVILMNRHDITAHGLTDGDVVDLYNHHEGRERVAHRFIVVAYPIPAGCTATYFPETNVLVPIGSTAHKSNTPTSKCVILKLKKHSPAGEVK